MTQQAGRRTSKRKELLMMIAPPIGLVLGLFIGNAFNDVSQPSTSEDLAPERDEQIQNIIDNGRNRDAFDILMMDNKCDILRQPYEEACRFLQNSARNAKPQAKI